MDPDLDRPDAPLILVVEDDYDARRMMARMLAPLGEIVTAADGAEALEQVLDRTPDLVVTDVMMPTLDGMQLTRYLHGDETLRRIPVIVVTAKNTPRDVIEGINAGARSYVTKPFTSEDLVSKARRALQNTGLSRA